MRSYAYDTTFAADADREYPDYESDDENARVRIAATPRSGGTRDAEEEFRTFASEIRAVDTCNLFEKRPDSFVFGDYVRRLTALLNAERYSDDSLKTIVNALKPTTRSFDGPRADNDGEFVGDLINFIEAVIDEPRIEPVAVETILLFNMLHSNRATIARNETDESDAPAAIGKFEGSGAPSRSRYVLSLDVLDLYETSCKPDVVLKRIRHPSYQDKCKLPTSHKYSSRPFLDSLKIAKATIRKRDSDTLKRYRDFLAVNGRAVFGDEDLKKNRQKINEDVARIQSYPSLRRSIIENGIGKLCKLSLAVERYAATRTSGSMDNENYQYPCFLHFCTM